MFEFQSKGIPYTNILVIADTEDEARKLLLIEGKKRKEEAIRKGKDEWIYPEYSSAEELEEGSKDNLMNVYEIKKGYLTRYYTED
ncbi:hypothetical protein CF081_19625 [Clostridium botulinum]|uniref:hypothetical protein n=1 Tax=Clostridium botulinum TaxID=1491 RepID=UPI000773E640|nr:hypothetical protein [Clostridium botulinum]AUN08974.1 hypothetical protein RSJ14_20135 [Clostridium botulinum]MBN3352628.1 hypothetical protein [Clostridium botulinum]MBN3368362.1 hypothetical protein [Clostridium botulinum]MBN3375882.1 hypothetical protein [Clostridium botulinum]